MSTLSYVTQKEKRKLKNKDLARRRRRLQQLDAGQQKTEPEGSKKLTDYGLQDPLKEAKKR